MDSKELATSAAMDLNCEFSDDLLVETENIISGKTNQTRGVLGTTAEIVTVATFLYHVSIFAWNQYKVIKDRNTLLQSVENEFQNHSSLNESKKKKIIQKVLEKLPV